jgi:hypothetical protein
MRRPTISLGMRVGRSGEEFHNTVERWKGNDLHPAIRERCRSLAEIYEKELDQLITHLNKLKPTPENERRLQSALEHKATLIQHSHSLDES